jgi:hypothetical protein
MNWYKIASKEFHYFGQCDKVRCDNVGENNWQDMIRRHLKVSPEEFVSKCSIEELLDPDELLEEMIGDDPDSYFAKSWWGNKPCYYLMTKGFEFIFLPKVI